MKKIKLTQNKEAIVDDEDFAFLSKYKWQLGYVGYASLSIKLKGKWQYVSMHRMIMNPSQNMQIDHINRNKLDNRRQNLRICTPSQNFANSKLMRTNTSGFRGIAWNKKRKKWSVRISTEGKRINLGYFHDKVTAAKAYDKAAKKYHGEFASLNF